MLRLSRHLNPKYSAVSALRSRAAPLSTAATADKPFDKILIANRGEIACRVIRTAKRLGVKTVAVYSEADASSMFVRMADEAYCIGSAASKDSYLRMDRIIEVCKRTGAQGIHPGYGFLSENAKFVDMVEHAGIAFIGPSSAPMLAMGDKINSKIVAKNANCFIIPGYHGEVRDENHAAELANEIGYPVMIKASAGGGGKGMRVAYNDEQVREGFRLSKSEALSSFGDDRMLIERFIEDPHHIEIQVIADTHGNVVAFPERECSVQRRNQKVVEESPSCLLLPKTRRMMQEQAIALCKAVGYRSAGTIEMLCDGNQNFYFLEMNTRLQVEHPVTELVSGEDLVEHMLWVAAGRKLPDRLTKQPCRDATGWAVESRVYAEDPLRNFLPSIGPLVTYREPPLKVNEDGITVRIDTGIYEGGEISMYYDPMICKLNTHGPTREAAITAMEEALDRYVVLGVINNITFLRSIMRNKVFRSGHYSTKFIGQEYPKGFHGVDLTEKETNEMIGAAIAMHLTQDQFVSTADNYKYIPPTHKDSQEFVVTVGGFNGKQYHVIAHSDDLGLHVSAGLYGSDKTKIPDQFETVRLSTMDWMRGSPLAEVTFVDDSSDETKEYNRYVQYEGKGPNGGYVIRHLGCDEEVMVRSLRQNDLNKHILPPEKKDVSRFLLCPMPGTLVSLSVTEGQSVEIGQQLAVVEAMKMQNILRSTKKGVIKAVKAKAGSSLKVDQIILEYA